MIAMQFGQHLFGCYCFWCKSPVVALHPCLGGAIVVSAPTAAFWKVDSSVAFVWQQHCITCPGVSLFGGAASLFLAQCVVVLVEAVSLLRQRL